MKKYLYNIYFDFCSDIRFTKIQVLFSLDPPASFPHTVTSLTGVNWANQQACLSDLVAHMGPTFSPGTRLDHAFVCVFNTGLLSLFLRQYCLDPLILKSCLYMFHTVRPNGYIFSKLGTLHFVSGFLLEKSLKSSTFHSPV